MALRIGGGFTLAAAGVLLGLFVGSSALGDPSDVQGNLAHPQVHRRERISEKTSLVIQPRQKAPSKRQYVASPSPVRSVTRASGIAAPSAPATSDAAQAAADAQLIRAAQLERPF